MNEEIAATYAEYSEARRRLIDLSPCPRCCPPGGPLNPGERLRYGNIVRCGKCGGNGFLITWDEEDE